MSERDHPGPAPDEIEAVRMLLEKMGISPADLLDESAKPPEVPTFSEYIPRVSAAVSAGTRRVYSTYWDRVIQTWGARPITSVTPLEISQLAEQVKANVVKRRNPLGGRMLGRRAPIGALRCVYKHSMADGIRLITRIPQRGAPALSRARSPVVAEQRITAPRRSRRVSDPAE